MSTAFVRQFETPAHDADEAKPGQEARVEESWLASATRISDILALGALRNAELRIVEPIRVSFATEDESIRACAEEIDEFGFGATYREALIDLQHAVAELYLSLERDRERLGPDLARVWSVLQSKIRRRDATPTA